MDDQDEIRKEVAGQPMMIHGQERAEGYAQGKLTINEE